ncbi:hypothetical protein [Bradyrhizobium liaoningense]|jgi:hypothetical protein|nr:hypothetical protein [Bradyrhizobium liaoningense]MBR1032129.1 hypothetical protein [Bradyrhizobium liaoningense]
MADEEPRRDYKSAADLLRDRYGEFRPLGELKRTPSISDKLLALATAPAKTAVKIVSGLADLGTLPMRAMDANQRYMETGQYDPAPFVEAAMLPTGAGAFAGVPRAAGETVLGAGAVRDPAMWRGLSEVKLRKPLAEMERTIVNPRASTERVISPEQLQGNVLLPALGDRAAIGGQVSRIGDVPISNPVDLQGGHGFMSAEGPHAWASEKGRMTTMANRVRRLQDEYGNVYAPYTAMGERAVDFSHHMSDALSEMLKHAPVTGKGAAEFDALMRAPRGKDFPAAESWPGVTSPDLRDYLINAPGVIRAKFAKEMDKARFAKEGFPDVAEARFAVTDPRLLNTPSMASGLSISRLDPVTSASPHRTYSTGIHGDYVGGFGQSIPKEVMFPDIAAAYAEQGYKPQQFNYLLERGTAPVYQETNQRWLDTVMDYINRGRAEP